MKVVLRNGKRASEEAIDALESALGYPLSGPVKAFVLAHDGAGPETNIFRISDNKGSGVNGFIPVGEILKARARIENIPAKAYPVAWAEGGNFVCVDEEKNGWAYYWDHELPGEPYQSGCGFCSLSGTPRSFRYKNDQPKTEPS